MRWGKVQVPGHPDVWVEAIRHNDDKWILCYVGEAEALIRAGAADESMLARSDKRGPYAARTDGDGDYFTRTQRAASPRQNASGRRWTVHRWKPRERAVLLPGGRQAIAHAERCERDYHERCAAPEHGRVRTVGRLPQSVGAERVVRQGNVIQFPRSAKLVFSAQGDVRPALLAAIAQMQDKARDMVLDFALAVLERQRNEAAQK